jgi:hypothetical protein
MFDGNVPFLLTWFAFLILAAVVVLPLLVVLAGRLIITAVKLNNHAAIADVAAIPVRRNTEPVPQLAQTLGLIRELVSVSRTMESHLAELERVLKRDLAVRR